MIPKQVMGGGGSREEAQGSWSLGKPDDNYRVQSIRWEVESGVKQS